MNALNTFLLSAKVEPSTISGELANLLFLKVTTKLETILFKRSGRKHLFKVTNYFLSGQVPITFTDESNRFERLH